MKSTNPTPLRLTRIKALLAFSIFIFLIAAILPYSWLIAHFGYDDILREPSATILTNFHAGGSPLVLAWFAFAMSALTFIPIAIGTRQLLTAHQTTDLGAHVLGGASAIVQTVGLLRWVFVVPGLASAFVASDTSATLQETLIVVFDSVHRYGGMVLGEMVGQLLLAGWTGLVSVQLYRSKAIPRWISTIGLLTIPFWIIGQTELLHIAVPQIPSIELVPIAFMAWEFWLLLIAISLSTSVWKARGQYETNPSPTA